MTLDEAILHAEEVVESCERGNPKKRSKSECASEHRQLAKWLKELKQLRKQTRWIPVSKRLPEQGQEVICQCRANIIKVMKLDANFDWYQDTDHCYMHRFVVAWMPLPEACKEESEG